MRKTFSKSIYKALITLVFCTSNLLANKLIIWAPIDQQINNKQSVENLSKYIKNNHQEIFKDIKIDYLNTPHLTLAVAGIISEKNGKKYVSHKGKQILLKDAVKAVDKAIAQNAILCEDKPEFSLKAGSRFSDPTSETQFYIIQQPLFAKNHPIHKLGTAISKELSAAGLNTEFKPLVSSTRIASNNKKPLGQLQYLQNAPKFFKPLKEAPAEKGLTCSKVQILINNGNNYEILKTYDLK